ncbi:unnamed protein product [Schistocephalus solidus]|uniref:Yippee domain-containing protein n=1 Tax=Schistocephalus solidus TaxID=70667 RepID=A0A183SI86_SCHSO|nr:unnamed protein product [Schistocephalus solidus]
MTRRFLVYLDSDDSAVTYSCVHCRAHLADYRYLISKSFQGSQGRAYLFEKIVNVKSSTAEDRLLLTGHHRVADIYCICCDTLLGWKYEKAFEPSQRYKEGKYIIELIHIIKDNQWDTFLTPHTKRRSSGYSTENLIQNFVEAARFPCVYENFGRCFKFLFEELGGAYFIISLLWLIASLRNSPQEHFDLL